MHFRTKKQGDVLILHRHAPLDIHMAKTFYVSWTDTQIAVGTEWDKTQNAFLR